MTEEQEQSVRALAETPTLTSSDRAALRALLREVDELREALEKVARYQAARS